MSEQLLQHISRFVSLKEEEKQEISAFFQCRHLKKKENVLKEGQLCKSNYFVVSGCVRMFFITDKGVEQTTHFAIENWWIADMMAFQQQKESNFYIQAIEPSHLLCLDLHSEQKLLEQFPVMEKYFRQIYQKAYAASQIGIKYRYDFSKEELYMHFYEHFPEFIQRVPQYLVASYLGFTPEYLSEIRKNKSKADKVDKKSLS